MPVFLIVSVAATFVGAVVALRMAKASWATALLAPAVTWVVLATAFFAFSGSDAALYGGIIVGLFAAALAGRLRGGQFAAYCAGFCLPFVAISVALTA